ncbi:MAG: hypothetical protein IKN24_07310 [Lachnospiraceae bacterium]|nr:hypothetical protein [Lachnospiraceae bacterium]
MKANFGTVIKTIICTIFVLLFAYSANIEVLADDGWVQDGDNWYYYENGEAVSDTIKKIGDSYYGFNYYGVMYDDLSFGMYGYYSNSYVWGYIYYRAKAGGALYVNEWYQDEFGTTYYYGENGRGAHGISEVGGNQYYFSYGAMQTNITVAKDMTVYYFGSDGTLSSSATLTNNKWTLFQDRYYYAKDNAAVINCVVKIGDIYYGFSDTGYMYTDTDDYFGSYYDGIWGHFRATADGSLIVNNWYKDSSGSWYYYGENGFAARGITEVKGILYYFYYTGQMAANCIVSDNEKTYMAADNGVLTEMKEGWNKYGGNYYYLQGGQYVRNEVRKIGENYYGFDSNGVMYDDQTFYFYEYDSDGNWLGCSDYRAKAGGTLYVNEWYHYQDDYNDQWYYYGAEGKAPNGLATVGGKQHYFQDGRMVTNSFTCVGGIVYRSDANGIATVFKEGWNLYDGSYYYVDNGDLVRNEVRLIKGKYYGFDYYGHMYDDQTFYLSTYDYDINRYFYYYYRAYAGGALYASEWYHDEDDTWYYYGADGRACEGVTNVKGKYYCFASNGKMMTDTIAASENAIYSFDENGEVKECVALVNNKWSYFQGRYYYMRDNAVVTDCVIKIGANYYGFSDSGYMYDDGDDQFFSYYQDGDSLLSGSFMAKDNGMLYVNEWYQGYWGEWYYYGDHGIVASGLKEIKGKQYYFDYWGRAAQNEMITIDDKLYAASASCALTPLKEGWNKCDGLWYYIENGSAVSNTIKNIDGFLYGFNYNGCMYDNTEFSLNGSYRAKPGGKLYVSKWYQDEAGIWYYYGADGKSPEGLTTIGGKQYYFENGRMVTGMVITVSGKSYMIDANGALTELKDGWNKVGGKYCYVSNGEIVRSGVRQINGKYYGFDGSGWMYDNETFSLYGYYDEEQNDTVYYYYAADEGGELYVDTWAVNNYGNYSYYGSDGKRASGITSIEGSLYYFNDQGILLENIVIYDSGKYYYACYDGTLGEMKAGWNRYDDIYFYLKNGELVRNCILKINGKYYGFDSTYRMYCSTSFEMYDENNDWISYRASESGALIENSWYQDDYGIWYYYGNNGKAPSGITTIGANQYYFRSTGRMEANTSVTENGKTYYAASNGVLTEMSADWSYAQTYGYSPVKANNLYSRLQRSDYLEKTDNGYMRVVYTGDDVVIEYYTDAFEYISNKHIDLELPVWGGFYNGSDAYYLVEAQYNREEDNEKEVIRVIKYDRSWKRQGAAAITGSGVFGGEVRYPFDYGCVEMTELDGMLYIVTGHEGYVDERYGQGHQGLLMMAVNEAEMTGKIVKCNLWHSFAQYIAHQNGTLYLLEQSEGSRYTSLNKITPGTYRSKEIAVLRYGGVHTSAWAIACFASVDDIAVSSNYVFGLGSSIDQTQYDNSNYNSPYNIYLTKTPINDFTEESTEVIWLTDYKDESPNFTNIKITEISDDRFLVMWGEVDYSNYYDDEVSHKFNGYSIHYLFIDGDGNILSEVYTAEAPASNCHPITVGDKVVYCASDYSTLEFYLIDVNSGELSFVDYNDSRPTWITKDGKSYCYKNCQMLTGWQKIDDIWYYFSNAGVMQTGWLKIGGSWYLFKDNGQMAENEWVDGYWLSAGGKWTYTARGSWRQNSKGRWFGDTSGWYAKNTTIKIDGEFYTFDANGYAK